jgi:hypothetical protein
MAWIEKSAAAFAAKARRQAQTRRMHVTILPGQRAQGSFGVLMPVELTRRSISRPLMLKMNLGTAPRFTAII